MSDDLTAAATRSPPDFAGGYGLKRMRHEAPSDTPTMTSKSGTSRCQPRAVPGRYSLTSAWTKRIGRLAGPERGLFTQRQQEWRYRRRIHALIRFEVIFRSIADDAALRCVLLVACLAQRQRADRFDQGRFLDRRNEFRRVDQPSGERRRFTEEITLSCFHVEMDRLGPRRFEHARNRTRRRPVEGEEITR
jgi:hypothetical protein